MPEVTCTYFPTCRGCDHWDQSYEQQKINKLAHLQKLLRLPDELIRGNKFISIKPYGLRQRFDFTVDENRMGLYDADRKLVDIEMCLQLSPELQKAFTLFRGIPLPVKKASVRLRVGPQGAIGCWLDLANIDVKNLLDDGTYLNQLLQMGFHVEIGQKGKTLKSANGKLKLTDPEPKVWFQTKDAHGNFFNLLSLVSDFTQPSWQSGEKLVEVVLQWTEDLQVTNAVEFGSGIGPFTLALLSKNIRVQAYENNPKAIEVLEQNAKAHNLEKNLEIFAGDFQNKSTETKPAPLVFVNPPRSGLKKFVDTIIATKAKHCIYISCFPESMQQDLEALKSAGYKIKDVRIVDQFPQTHHYESCVLLEKT
jgi:23S rRNA (uracil1939-C5)-methyltransferase